jgi:hypothetical protein
MWIRQFFFFDMMMGRGALRVLVKSVLEFRIRMRSRRITGTLFFKIIKINY